MGEVVASLLLAATVAASGINGGGFNAQWAFTMSGFRSGLQSNPMSPTVWMDSKASGSQGISATTLTYSLNNAAGSYLLIGIASRTSPSATIWAVRYNYQNATLLVSVTNGLLRTEIWGLASPATGAHPVDIYYVVLGAGITSVSGAATFRNASGVSNTTAATGSSTAPSVTITSAVGSVAFDAVGVTVGAIHAVTAGHIQEWNLADGVGAAKTMCGGQRENGAGSVVMGWTDSGSDPWADVGLSVNP